MKMQTFRKPHQWQSFWLEKYIEILTSLKYDGEKRKRYWAILKVFLEELPGNPRNLALAEVKSFIAVEPVERLIPISLFYQHIAPSRPHLEMLKKFDSTDHDAHVKHTETPLEKFEEHLLKQQLSDRTVKNYCTAVTGYLKWTEEKKYEPTVVSVDKYCTMLSTVKQLAPRTVTMHHTALKLFFSTFDSAPSPDPAK